MAPTKRSGGKMAPPPMAQLRESPVDRVSSLIVSLLVLAGVLVGGMFSVWFSFKLAKPVQIAVPVRLDPGGGGDPNGVVGEKLNLEGPEREEIGQNSDVLEPAIQNTMDLLVDATAKQVADIAADPVFGADNDADAGGGGGSRGNSNKRGFGYGHGPGGGGGPEWEMKYDESTLAAYAQQLDFFKIELAVVGGTKDRIEYASGFSQGASSRRTGTRDAEQSLKPHRTYFSHTSGTVEKYDRQLLAKAGINTQGFGLIILQYYPKAAEEQLLLAQQQYRGLDQPAIKKTVFGIRRQGSGFQFFVIDQVRR